MKLQKMWALPLIAVLLIGATFSALGVEKTFDEKIARKLQTALDAAVKSPEANFPGALLRISSPELGTWSDAAGLGNIETNIPMRPDDKFRAGSIMKTFVAVVALQLVEEGRLSLGDRLPAVLPEEISARFANSNKITVRMLLNHTSGIPDWLTPAAFGEIGANPQKVWQVDEFFDLVAAQEPYFAPGEGWRYSNTEYNLLGLIIEQATGRSWRQEVRERIIEPLHLENTQLPEPGDVSIPPNHARGYHEISGKLVDFTEVDPSMAGAAGGHALVTTTTDLARFLNAVLAGELFQNARTLDEMLKFVDATYVGGQVGYGLGMQKFIWPGGIEALGHAGGTAGYRSLVAYLPTQDVTISMAITNMEGDPTPVLFPALEILVPQSARVRQ